MRYEWYLSLGLISPCDHCTTQDTAEPYILVDVSSSYVQINTKKILYVLSLKSHWTRQLPETASSHENDVTKSAKEYQSWLEQQKN